MRHIKLDGRTPTDKDIPGWRPWTKQEWDEWLAESVRLTKELSRLVNAGKIDERNALIDANDKHWGKLKDWLRSLSFGKCWFTESPDAASHMEVEHFRPKKVAKELDGTQRDGYWWLAFEYSNYRLTGNVPNRKKGGWFPLREQTRRSCFDARCEESEAYCLIDPIRENDTALIAFNEAGDAIPAPGVKDEWRLKRVAETIKRLKLNEHPALPERRRMVWKAVSDQIDIYLNAREAYNPGINDAPLGTFLQALRTIKGMTQRNEPFSKVAIWCVRLRNDEDLNWEVQE